MRFRDVRIYQIDELKLDEGNYRFKHADDQKDCVAKIYLTNPAYFRGLMQSIAEDDLGEPLLVYKNEETNVVLDGNRRLAALKVLSDDEFLPAEGLKAFVEELRKANALDFSNIQAQVSTDKKLILRTVYERHAGTKTGKNRIGWNAYANARFSFHEEIGNNNEWHFIALLTRTEEEHSEITEFLDGKKFSYETYRRLMRVAFKRDLISRDIFSERTKRIKNTAPKNLVDDAIDKTLKILDAIDNRDISLARGENFADKSTVEVFFDNFSVSPDVQRAADAKNAASQNGDDIEGPTSSSNEKSKYDGAGEADSRRRINDVDTKGDEGVGAESYKQGGYGVTKSDDIEKKLIKLESTKLSRLYYSLNTVSLNMHPELMYAGAWMFFEILAKAIGNVDEKTGKRKHEFKGFLNSRMQSWKFQDETRKECFSALGEIQEFGNSAKHSVTKTRMSAIQLRNDFEVLEPLILAAIDSAISKKTKKLA